MTMPGSPSPRGDRRPLPKRAPDSVIRERVNRRRQRRRRRQIRSVILGVVILLALIFLLTKCLGGDDSSSTGPSNDSSDSNGESGGSGEGANPGAAPTIEVTAATIAGGGEIAAADQEAVKKALTQYASLGIDQAAKAGTKPAGFDSLFTPEAAGQLTQQAVDVLTDASVGPESTTGDATVISAALTGGIKDEAGTITVIAARVRINAVFTKEGSSQTISQRAGDLSFIRDGTSWLIDGWDMEVRRAGGGVDTPTQATSKVEADGQNGAAAPQPAFNSGPAGASVPVQGATADAGTATADSAAATARLGTATSGGSPSTSPVNPASLNVADQLEQSNSASPDGPAPIAENIPVSG